jgi:hypothetical protein
MNITRKRRHLALGEKLGPAHTEGVIFNGG